MLDNNYNVFLIDMGNSNKITSYSISVEVDS